MGGQNKGEEKDLKYCALYLAEPGFGTKLFDHEHTMEGLALALKLNGFSDKVSQVVIQGGVIPHVPPYTSKSYLNDLKLLGTIDIEKGEEKTPSDQMLEERLQTPYEEEYYHTKVHTETRRKIGNLEDAFEVAGQQLRTLMGVFPKETVLRIQTGEEDKKNIGYLEMGKIKGAAKERNAQLKEVFGEIVERKSQLSEDLMKTRIQKYVFSKISEKEFQFISGEGKKEYYPRLSKVCRSEVFRIMKELSLKDKIKEKEREEHLLSAIKYATWAQGRGMLKEKLKEAETKINELKSEDKRLKKKALGIDRNIKWSESLLEEGSKSVSFFTGQLPITPEEAEIYWASAKEEYTRKFHNWNLKQKPLVHVTGRKEFNTGDTITMDDETGKKKTTKGKGGKSMFVTHNLKTAFSEAVSARSIREGKLHLNFRNMVLDKLGIKEGSPDYLLLGGHEGGGFRVMPWFKESERDEEGVFVKDQGISYLISLPTLQDIGKLEWAANHNFSGWHIKSYLQGPYGSAAIIHTEDEEGVNAFNVWDTQKLIEWGKIAKEIEGYKDGLKKEGISTKDKKKLRATIRKLERSVVTEYKKLETTGDYHFGAPANRDRYSTDQLVEAGQIYQQRTGLPEIVVWDELTNGLQTFHGGEADYQADIAPLFKKRMEEIEQIKGLSWKKKCDRVLREALKNQRAIPVFNAAEQKKYFQYMLKPYADEVLANEGKLILMSGNHSNNSQRQTDEATELANQFSIKQRESGQIISFHGKATSVGLGLITLPGGQRLYATHKFPERMDEVYGAMMHLRKMNNDADIVFSGDRHQTGAGYADGHMVTVHPGLQSMNKYVATIGKPAGLRGFQNVHYDPNQRGVYKVEFVLNNTLEKIIEDENIR